MDIHDDEPFPPRPDEDRDQYCARLEANGFEEMQIRKALRGRFGMDWEEMGDYFEKFPDARLRHLILLKEVYPQGFYKDDRLSRKIRLNLGISQERAEYWVTKIRSHEAAKPK